jgi:hypothetical protein
LARIKLDNAIAVVRAGEARGSAGTLANQLAARWDAHESRTPEQQPAEPTI